MTMTDETTTELRDLILADPGLVLEDQEVMQALLRADRRTAGRNVVDLRGVLVDRLEDRLDRLEDTHREVLAAAYDNVAGMNQVHRACLAVLAPGDFASYLAVLTREVPRILGVEIVRLGLEAPAAEPGQPLGPAGPVHDVVVALPAGGAETYATGGRGLGARRVTLRELAQASPDFYGSLAPRIRSEAVMLLDLGDGNHPGLLVLGALDAGRFHAEQGTDLLDFLRGVFELSLRRWLA
jgi:uncharacterized protein YigA (DUF484 family)